MSTSCSDTALIGKWGLDGNYRSPVPPGTGFPTKHGFSYFYGQSDQWQCHNYYPSFQFLNDRNITVPKNVGASDAKCGPFRAHCSWSGDMWTKAAVEYIHNHSKYSGRPPFFLYLV